MPLIQKKSKKAFESNLKTEMHEGKPQKQALAIAYAVKRKPKHKMAEGGAVEDRSKMSGKSGKLRTDTEANQNQKGVHQHGSKGHSGGISEAGSAQRDYGSKPQDVRGTYGKERAAAVKPEHQRVLSELKSMPKPKIQGLAEGGAVSASNEKRPMPEDRHDDAHEVARSAAKKALAQDQWTDQPTVRQAQSKPKVEPITRPKMVPSSAFSTRLYNKEGRLEESEAPASPSEQPEHDMDEMGADRQGPKTHDLKLKMMAKGGMLEDADHLGDMHHKAVDDEFGGKAEEDMLQEPSGLEGDDDEMSQPEHEFMAGKAKMLATGGDIEDAPQAVKINYTSRPDTGHGAVVMKADGGMLKDEMEEEHHNSIAAAIMAKRNRMVSGSDSDEDHMMRMAEGGEVALDENAMEHPNQFYHENEDEVLKENYDEPIHHASDPMDSNEHGHSLSDEDAHSMVDKIRKMMKAKRQF